MSGIILLLVLSVWVYLATIITRFVVQKMRPGKYRYLANVIVFVFIFIAVLLIVGMLGGKLDFMSDKNKKYFTWSVAVIMCLLIVYGLYLSNVQIDLGPISYDFLRSVIPIAIAILVFILIVWFITSPGKTREEERRTEEAEKREEQAKPAEKKKKYEAPKVLTREKIEEPVLSLARRDPESFLDAVSRAAKLVKPK